MIEIFDDKISLKKLYKFLKDPYPEMIKFVVDLEKESVAMGGAFHADGEALLLDQGSQQDNLWGGNLYIDKSGTCRVEYSAMINIRPSAGNRSIEVEKEEIRKRIKQILDKLLP